VPPLTPNFCIDNFLFTPVNEADDEDDDLDSLAYIVSNELKDFSLYMGFHGVNTTANTGPDSNVDFMYFKWQYLERFSFKKHALVIHASDDLFPTRPRLLAPRHYRASSDGWNDSHDCDRCVQLYQDALLPFSSRRLPAADYTCPICLRQPPSLLDLCLPVINKGTTGFQLTVHTTFDEYKLAFESESVPLALLQSPQYPNVHIRCQFGSTSFDHRYHNTCVLGGVRLDLGLQTASHAVLRASVIEDLVKNQNMYWYRYCDKGLFFPVSCNRPYSLISDIADDDGNGVDDILFDDLL
jgi:hypothetical protein